MKKRISIIGILLLLLLIIFIYKKIEKKEYESTIFYMDTNIYIKLLTNDSIMAKKTLEKVEQIYKEYHELTDRYNKYNNTNNIYTINNNLTKDEYLKIDKRLYQLIEYGINMYEKSNGKVDISMGNVIDIWKGYRSLGTGIPSLEELNYVNYGDIKKIILKDKEYIKNNNLNLDLGCIAKGYTSEVVADYLKSVGINEFLINAGGNVIVGENYKKGYYKIGLEDPNNSGDIYKIIKVKNKSIVTSGSYQRYYEYNDKIYHHIIDPDTLFPSDYMKSVTVITDDSKYGEFLSTYLFLLSVEDGKKYVEKLSNVDVIWYLNDNTYTTSSGFDKYE